MEGVVANPHGTATRAQIPGYTIAGKTGTAAKLVNGHYSTTDYNASFVGFVPSNRPAVAIIVVTDSPHVYPNTGGWVSAPVFKRIAEATLRYLGVPQTIDPPTPVLVARDSDGDRQPVTMQATMDAVVSLIADGPPGTVPDLAGMSARDAVRRLVRLRLLAPPPRGGLLVSP